MKNTKVNHLIASLVTYAALVLGAKGAITIAIIEDPTGVTMTATGTYNFNLLTPQSDGAGLGSLAGISPLLNTYGWDPSTPNKDVYILTSNGGSGFSGAPTGSDSNFSPDNVTTTNPFFINITNNAVHFNDSAPNVGTVNEYARFDGITLSSLGMVAGESFTATWQALDPDNGFQPFTDSINIQVSSIPEPSTAGLAFLGMSLFVFTRRRR